MNRPRTASSPLGLFAALGAGLLSACALTPPARSTPAISREGIAVAVVAQRCDRANETDATDQLTELVVSVRVHNPTPDLATVHVGDFRLSGDERYSLKASSAVEPLQVAPGTDQTFDLRFMARGAFECGQELRLDPGRGVVTRDQAVKLPTVTFVPRAQAMRTLPPWTQAPMRAG